MSDPEMEVNTAEEEALGSQAGQLGGQEGPEGGEPGKQKTVRKKKVTPPANPCLCCGDNCAKGQLAVKCVLCALWAHKLCLKMPDATYKQLDQQFRETGLAYWVCRPCQNFSQRVKHQFEISDKRHEATERRVDSHEKRLEDQDRKIEEMKIAMRQMAERMEAEAETRDRRMVGELQEWSCRRKNLVLHGLREPPTEIRANRERMEWDINCCGQLFQTIGVSTRKDEIRFCRRVGEIGMEPRPVIIGLYSEDVKEQLLAKARNLRGTCYENVSIVPDLPKKQREQEADLKMEADRRNQGLMEDRRRNVKWLVVGRRGEKRIIKGVERDREGWRYEGSNDGRRLGGGPVVPQPGEGRGGGGPGGAGGRGSGGGEGRRGRERGTRTWQRQWTRICTIQICQRALWTRWQHNGWK